MRGNGDVIVDARKGYDVGRARFGDAPDFISKTIRPEQILDDARTDHQVDGMVRKGGVSDLALNWTDFEDAVQAACAEKAEADYLVTRDKKGFRRSPVKTVTPAELLALIP